jgi:hypothetical protein
MIATCWADDARAAAAGISSAGTRFGSSAEVAGASKARPVPSAATDT